MNYKNLKYCIKRQIVCNKCIEELTNQKSTDINLKNFAQFEVGFTSIGIQVWCIRHDINVCHIDFNGNQLSADFRCIELKKN